MKIIAINGSPRGMKGNTGRLLEEVLAGVAQAGAEVEIVSLGEISVKPCTACDACHKVGSCPIKDDYEPLKKKLLAANGIILATPNYIFSVTAQMKAFFDRCCGIIHCNQLEGKYVALVETSGGGGDDDVLAYMSRFVNSVGAVTVGGVGSVQGGWRAFPEQDALFEKARTLGRDLCAAIKEKRAFPEQEEARLAFKARMEQLISFMGDHWTYEKEFWVSKSR